MEFELICDGVLINKHSNGGKHYGWNNPLDILPPVGSTIEYMTFNQGVGYKDGNGVLTKYLVKGYTFTTEEDYNHCYRNKVCKIHVEVV